MIFTRHVTESRNQDIDQVLADLAPILRQQLRKRGIYDSSPAFLDYSEYKSWKDTEAFKTLLFECYGFCFCEKLEAMRNYLKENTTIDALVVRNVKNFIHDRQSRRDPIGYRTYRNCRKAICELEISGLLVSGAVAAKKILRAPDFREGPIASPEAVEAFVDAFPGWDQFYRAVGSLSAGGTTFLVKLIQGMIFGNVRAFEFSDLLKSVRLAVRSRFQTVSYDDKIHSKDQPDTPDQQPSLSDMFNLVLVEEKINESRSGSTRADLKDLLGHVLEYLHKKGELNHSDLADIRGMPTSTHHDQWKKLQKIFHECAFDSTSG